MQLNQLSPAEGSKKAAKRVGRGIGCGSGKTCGRGHKGQKSRSGGWHKVGFEGGQMPIQRRLPKFGFTSRMAKYYSEVRLSELKDVDGDSISIETLAKAGIIPVYTKTVKIIKSGSVEKAFTFVGVRVTAGARSDIEAAGGKVEE